MSLAPPSAAEGGLSRLAAGAVVAGLALVNALALGLLLVYPDLSWSYPFPGPDSDDWISNGLALAGEEVRYTVRPPLLPLLLAGLYRAGALAWFPLVNQLVLAAGVVTLYALLARRFSPRVSLAVSLIYLVAAPLELTSLYVGADLLASVLLLGAALAFLAAGGRPVLYLLAGLAAGLSAVTQQAALLWPLPVAATALVYRRSHLRRPAFWAGAAAFAVVPIGWMVAKRLAFGSFGDVVVLHWHLLRPGLDELDFYAVAAASLLGWPAFLLGLWGVARSLRRLAADTNAAFLLLLALTTAGFFVFFYQFQARRLLLYAAWPAGYFVARALACLEGRRWAFAAVAGMVALGAALPPPGATQWGEPRLLLWPAPAVTLVLGPPPERGVRFERSSWWEPAAGAAHARVVAARREERPPPPPPALAEGAGSVVYLFPPRLAWETRYQDQLRLGNALRRRVKVVPGDLYPQRWWGFAGAEHLADVEPFVLLRVPLPDPEHPTLLALRRHDPRVGELRGSARYAPPPRPRALDRARSRAAEVAAEVEGPDGFLAVLAAPAEWVRLLPFVTGTSSLYIPTAAERPIWIRDLGSGPWLERLSVAGHPAGRRWVQGWRVLVVLPHRGGGA